MSSARKIIHLDNEFQMHRGGVLPRLDVAYETWGQLAKNGDNAVLLFTGLSPSAHAASLSVWQMLQALGDSNASVAAGVGGNME